MKKTKKHSENNKWFRSAGDRREDDPYFDLAKSKENWRRAFFLCAFTLVLVTSAFIVRSFQVGYVPYLVSVEDFDRVTVLGPAEKLNANHERLVRAELYQWIRKMRSVQGDEAFVRNQLSEAFQMVSAEVSGRMNSYYSDRENDPRVLSRNFRRAIDVSQIMQTDNSGNWRILWVETTTNTRGGNPRSVEWEAFIKVENHPPTTSSSIISNPLGLFVTELNWGEISPTTHNE